MQHRRHRTPIYVGVVRCYKGWQTQQAGLTWKTRAKVDSEVLYDGVARSNVQVIAEQRKHTILVDHKVKRPGLGKEGEAVPDL